MLSVACFIVKFESRYAQCRHCECLYTGCHNFICLTECINAEWCFFRYTELVYMLTARTCILVVLNVVMLSGAFLL